MNDDKILIVTPDTSDTERPALYCGTYAKYNNGSIAGKWLYLDDYKTPEEFLQACAELHKDEANPEFMFQDYEYLPEDLYSEAMSLKDLEQVYQYINLDEHDREILIEYIDATGYNFDDSIDHFEDAYETELDSQNKEDQQREYGEYVIDNGLFGVDIPDNLANYIDYEAIGRDCLMDCSISSNGFVFRSY